MNNSFVKYTWNHRECGTTSSSSSWRIDKIYMMTMPTGSWIPSASEGAIESHHPLVSKSFEFFNNRNCPFSRLVQVCLIGPIGAPKGRRAKCKLSPLSAFFSKPFLGWVKNVELWVLDMLLTWIKSQNVFWPSVIRPLDRELQASKVRNFLA